MTTITLEQIQARQTELAAMIEQLTNGQASRTIEIDDCSIDLEPGEHYAGAVLDEFGEHKHHLVLMAARPDKKLTWYDAAKWAASITDGELPDRQEAALLFANCKTHLPAGWHWTSETHESDASYAWDCYFATGGQGLDHESYEGSAVAVRRV